MMLAWRHRGESAGHLIAQRERMARELVTTPPVEAAHPHTGRDLMPGRRPKQFAILVLTVRPCPR